MLEVRDLHCSYGPVAAVRGISLEVRDGSLIAILGANGAGKSTTLKAIAGTVHPWRGRIVLDGKDITRGGAARRMAHGIALCPEGRRIFTKFTVRENLMIGGHTLSGSQLSSAIARAVELFPFLGERMNQPAGSLSGGEQQMLAIGRALMTRPKILLLDEPSLGLAPIVTQQVFEIIQDTHRSGTTVVLVEQNARMALKIADRAYVLANGTVDSSGTAQQVAAGGEIERSYLGGK